MLQYIFDDRGEAVGVFLPIKDWDELTKKYQDLSLLDGNLLPDWQREIIDQRLAVIKDNPERLRPIQELFDEMEKD